MNVTCPSCGVAVVAGYVRCPKCHVTLRSANVANVQGSGGTALRSTSGFPLPLTVGISIVLIAAMVWMVRSCQAVEWEADPEPTPASPTVTAGSTTTPISPSPSGPELAPLVAPTVNRQAILDELDRALDRQRLWVTLEAQNEILDVRTDACREAALAQTIAETTAALRRAGLTRLRCLSQSGTVVFQRGL